MEWKQQSTGASKDGKTFKLKLITVSLYNIYYGLRNQYMCD